jgi:hypothetical protein
MVVRSFENWTWDQLDPKTRIVIAAFAGKDGKIGDGADELPKQDFLDAYSAAFPHKAKVVATMAKPDQTLYSLNGVRNSIVIGLDPESTRRITEEMAILAGGDVQLEDLGSIAVAGLHHDRPLIAQEAVRRVDTKTAFNALETLSEMAVARMAQPES